MPRPAGLCLFSPLLVGRSILYRLDSSDSKDAGLSDASRPGDAAGPDAAPPSCTGEDGQPVPTKTYVVSRSIPETVPIRLDLEPGWLSPGCGVLVTHESAVLPVQLESYAQETQQIAWIKSPGLGSRDLIVIAQSDRNDISLQRLNGGGYWHLANGDDSSIHHNDLVPGGHTRLVDRGQYGGVLQVLFDQNDYARVPADPDQQELGAGGIDPHLGDFSISLWVRIDSVVADGQYLAAGILQSAFPEEPIANDAPLRIGGDSDDPPQWSGQIDEVLYAPGILSQAWFEAAFEAGHPDLAVIDEM